MKITIPENLSIPYWLVESTGEGMYKVSNQANRGQPYNTPSIMASVNLSVSGIPIELNVPVVYKVIDPAEGEIYRPLFITPPVTAQFDDDVLVFTKGADRKINITLTAIQDSIDGVLQLKIPEIGWKVTPTEIPFSFKNSGESVTLSCTITPPDVESKSSIVPEIRVNGQTYHHKVTTLDYDHLPYMSIVRDATAKLESIDLKMIPRRIAYIEGAGDDIPEDLEQIGYDVDIIDPSSMTPSLLNNYQVVILGIRAFNTIDALAYKNKMLFEWVSSGGTMIVQYNTNRGLTTDEIAPYPLTISRIRTTEENSPVAILHPELDVFNYPNKINATDFDDWVQERGLYFPEKWDEHFTPLLEMKDKGESPAQGSLLLARYGNGYYVYSGLSWFRHLPAGVPGAYRLLSNIISLGHKNSKS
jgi:hypothetical protein